MSSDNGCGRLIEVERKDEVVELVADEDVIELKNCEAAEDEGATDADNDEACDAAEDESRFKTEVASGASVWELLLPTLRALKVVCCSVSVVAAAAGCVEFVVCAGVSLHFEVGG